MSTTATKANVKHPSHTYRTRMEWAGGRGGNSIADGKPTFRVASPPEFKGEPNVWSPEDLIVQALNGCTMTTFIGFAARKNVPVAAYACDATGVLEFVETAY